MTDTPTTSEEVRNPRPGERVTVTEWEYKDHNDPLGTYPVSFINHSSAFHVLVDGIYRLPKAWKWPEREPQVGDKVIVTEFLPLARDNFREFIDNRVVVYAGRDTSTMSEGEHKIALADGEKWPAELLISIPDRVRVKSVRLAEEGHVPPPLPNPDEPDWSALIRSVLDDVQTEACEQDWCSEYEETMREVFGIEVEDRSMSWDVSVTLTRNVDIDRLLTVDQVFGGPGEDREVRTTSMVDISGDALVTVSGPSGGPDRDEVQDALDAEGYEYDDFDIDDYEAVPN